MLHVCLVRLLHSTSQEAVTEMVNERQKSSRRFPINLPTPLLKRNRQPTSHQDNTAATQLQSGHGNQSSNNPGTESHTHFFTQPPQSASGMSTSAAAPALALTAISNVAASAAIASSVGAGGQRSNTARAAADPQVPAAASQQSGSGEVMRKKAPRELTSFPPYTSRQTEKSEPLPARASSLVTSERPSQQGQGQGDKTVQKPEPAAGEEAGSGEGQSTPQSVDYGPVEPLQPISEGWSLSVCPCW